MPNNTNALIVEDELIIAEKIKGILEDLDVSVAGIAISYDEAIEIFEDNQIDLVLADINLGGKKDGIDLIAKIKESHSFTTVIISSYTDSDTLKRAKLVKPDAYLVKPFSQEDLSCCLEIALLRVQSDGPLPDDYSIQPEHIYIKSKNSIVRLAQNDITHLSSDDIYCKVFINDGSSHLIRYGLKKLVDKLPTNFIRVHKSHAINFDHFQKMDYDTVYVLDNKIPIGRSFRESLLAKIDLI